jgi:hypothetical protein
MVRRLADGPPRFSGWSLTYINRIAVDLDPDAPIAGHKGGGFIRAL